jgi:hypothetical protein
MMLFSFPKVIITCYLLDKVTILLFLWIFFGIPSSDRKHSFSRYKANVADNSINAESYHTHCAVKRYCFLWKSLMSLVNTHNTISASFFMVILI